jgi:hypothetical protein
VWDLAAGRDIATLSHTHPVTSLQFNPCEFVLATTCKDRCVRFWDLETFLVLDTLGPEATAARSCYFVPDGSTLLAAYQDSLKQYAYDPVATMKHIDVQWGHVVDLAIWNTSAVAASLNGPTVSVWCLEMDRAPKSALEMPSPQQNGTFPVSENEFRRSGARATKQPEQAASGIGNVHVVQRVSKSNLAKPSVPAVEPQADRALHGNENGHAHAHRVEVVDEALKVCFRIHDAHGKSCRQPYLLMCVLGRMARGSVCVRVAVKLRRKTNIDKPLKRACMPELMQELCALGMYSTPYMLAAFHTFSFNKLPFSRCVTTVLLAITSLLFAEPHTSTKTWPCKCVYRGRGISFARRHGCL